MTRDSAATLLFVDGGGFCKTCWDPIVRRLKAAPLLAGADFVTFDFSWHGSNYDHSVAAQVDHSDPQKPRVDHPAKNLTTWAPQEVYEQVQRIRAGQRARGQSDKTPIYGVGHSMGAMALWKTEVMHPGTFASLSLFEPGYGYRHAAKRLHPQWPTRLAAEDHFYDLKNFARWDREALAGYLRGGLIDQDDGSVLLACHPLIEASLYCHTPMYLSDELSKIHNSKAFGEMATKYPQIYRTRPLMPGLSHALVMENPAGCANSVLADLKELITTSIEQTAPHSRI
ncbi:hypothetical protein PHYSODRAFT_312151 [Phytophthora sojae]|uniref:AB hydrolase-1 domain-containing protein n=1 Tax=Phytophthora sojae (strain P6497) TaxID=1094619 RepID=G4Z1J8_PHYSP|nr:hypothetical protein PHYSODRAFT_312151 [Phytophthora sojae]EGZ25909.1 hypothetical protein PHYSODRAFT_312151 [Phytophthora sojae]|eukprot:XP_009521197.1 hypothetical protein PHYSODRAFT_312151 [Phytophthora sojae]